MLDEFLAFEGDGAVDVPEEIVAAEWGFVLRIIWGVFYVRDGLEEDGLVLLELFFLGLAGAGGLAVDLLEDGDAVLGVFGGFWGVVV